MSQHQFPVAFGDDSETAARGFTFYSEVTSFETGEYIDDARVAQLGGIVEDYDFTYIHPEDLVPGVTGGVRALRYDQQESELLLEITFALDRPVTPVDVERRARLNEYSGRTSGRR